jgi:hypothetical protein
MLELWDDQTNLLILSWMGQEKGLMFNRRDTETEIDLSSK